MVIQFGLFGSISFSLASYLFQFSVCMGIFYEIVTSALWGCEKWWVFRKSRVLMISRFQALTSVFLQVLWLRVFPQTFSNLRIAGSCLCVANKIWSVFIAWNFFWLLSSSILKPCRCFLWSIYTSILNFCKGTGVHWVQASMFPLQLTCNFFGFWINQN